MRYAIPVIAVWCLTTPLTAQTPDTVFLEELTWMEVRDAVGAGTTTVIIPTGGTEQNGPHMVLGKHNYLVKYKAGEIARRLGGTLVAPVMAYVPEGDVDPPTGHMRFAGTITTPPEVFAQVLEVRGQKPPAARLPRHRPHRRQRRQPGRAAGGRRRAQQRMG